MKTFTLVIKQSGVRKVEANSMEEAIQKQQEYFPDETIIDSWENQ